ncbi:unnamed protein product [Ambrosiozyma monospora]|uniref:Unnamed protein product n=1 Tax=Ambrosiozyma monospora TaxID=43982 RepID=A0ACB5TAZ9_AMBMO|nr:unnamed protein product [Ambrosiozyma monospora]
MPHIVFDIIGTCIGYDVMLEAIDKRIGSKLRQHDCNPELFFNAWGAACERDFSYLSLIGHYQPTKKILKSIFFRTLYHAGIKEPESIADEEDLDWLCNEWLKLKSRDGLPEMWKYLRDNGFTIWCLTDGDKERVKGYFVNSKLDMPDENIISCDSLGVGKPTPSVYEFMLDTIKTTSGSDADENIWFGAAHAWDCCAARKAGFKTAWVDVYEKYPCDDIFGTNDVVAQGLKEMGEKVVETHAKLTKV